MFVVERSREVLLRIFVVWESRHPLCASESAFRVGQKQGDQVVSGQLIAKLVEEEKAEAEML